MPRVRSPRDPNTWDANQVVAYNFKLAREIREWTQEETAQRLEGFLGQRLKKTSISAIERSVDSERRRVFTVQEIVGYSVTFGVSFLWFLIPPPDEKGQTPRRLEGYNGPLMDLLGLVLGREDEVLALSKRVAELTKANRGQAHSIATDSLGFGVEESWEHFEAFRRDQLVDMVVIERDRLETLFDEMKELVATFDKTRKSMALSAEYPRKAYRNISEIILGERIYGAIRNEFRPVTRSSLLDVVDHDDIPWEDIIDTADPAVTEAIQNLAHAIEPKAREYLDKLAEAHYWRLPTANTDAPKNEPGA